MGVVGRAEVRKVFRSTKIGPIAGCFVVEGSIGRNATYRLLRGGKEVWVGHLSSLRRFQDEVQSINKNFECGIRLDGWEDIRSDDVLECLAS